MATIVYIGISLIRIAPTNSSQLEISENAGISWKTQFFGHSEIGEFYHLGKNNFYLFARTNLGNFRSVTKGKTWEIWR